jgi:hypothetical protein
VTARERSIGQQPFKFLRGPVFGLIRRPDAGPNLVCRVIAYQVPSVLAEWGFFHLDERDVFWLLEGHRYARESLRTANSTWNSSGRLLPPFRPLSRSRTSANA